MNIGSKMLGFFYGELPPEVSEAEWGKLSQKHSIPKWLTKLISRGIYNEVKNTAEKLTRCSK